ncbi:MAG: hypothetical protein ABFS46_14060 [Myxococcota bacterium]
MPLYLARGPATLAFLIRARDRDHLNYIIDAMFDPGMFEVEVYDGPLALTLSLPAELDGETDFADAEPDLKVRFTGSLEHLKVLHEERDRRDDPRLARESPGAGSPFSPQRGRGARLGRRTGSYWGSGAQAVTIQPRTSAPSS